MNDSRSFEELRNRAYCPFAESANAQLGPTWVQDLSIEDNILQHIEPLTLFSLNGREEKKDMYVMSIRDIALVESLEALTYTFRSILYYLNSYDPKKPEGDLFLDIEDLSWNFLFTGVKYFIPVFAPFYRTDHPRCSFNPEVAFLLFQPDFSFDKHNINSKNPNRRIISEQIRNVYMQNGVPYNIDLVVGTPKAIRYIKPENILDEPVRWWEAK